MKQSIAIVHYNTPELTEACIKSLRKHMCNWPVYIFDNSDTKPFTKKMWGVTVFDNTKGQYVDFDKELAKYPDRIKDDEKFSNFGSSKHQWSVQKLWELLPDGFIMVESDVLITRDIRWMWNEQFAAVGGKQEPKGYPFKNDRLLPMLCYMNVPLLKKHGAKYFDPKRTYLLFGDPGIRENWYDTGATLLEDIRNTKPYLWANIIHNISSYYIHYWHGSWGAKTDSKFRKSEKDMLFWINANRKYWELPRKEVESQKTCVFVMGRRENRYAVEFVEHYKKCGFDKVYVYDNNREGEERFADVLAKYVKNGFVEIIENHNFAHQHNVYNDFYRAHKDEYQWIAFFDFDELLWMPKGMKIKKLMERAGDADCMLVNWQIMTDNGLLKYDKRKMAVRFPVPADEKVERADGVVYNEHTKTIIRGGIIDFDFKSQPHCPDRPLMRVVDSNGTPIKQQWRQPVPDTDVRLRHYMTKTIEEFVKCKSAREFPLDRHYNDVWAKYAMENFWAINGHTPEKDKWWNENIKNV